MSFQARRGRADDYPLFVRLVPELHIEDPVPSAEQWQARMLPETIVLESDGVPVGYAFAQLYGESAHLVHVVVDPSARGRGAGRALVEAARERVVGAGCTSWSLNVKQDNVAAMRVYERCGFACEHESWALETAWRALTFPRRGIDVVPFVPSAANDDELEARLGLARGRLAILHARPELICVGLRTGGVCAAFGAFDPGFPGVHPVRLADVDLAGPLFDALRPHAREDRVVVVVEGDHALHDLLIGSGARVLHALFRMKATLGGG